MCENGGFSLTYTTITWSAKSNFKIIIDGMVEAMLPVLLCGLLKVHWKHSNRAVTLKQQSCMSSYLEL